MAEAWRHATNGGSCQHFHFTQELADEEYLDDLPHSEVVSHLGPRADVTIHIRALGGMQQGAVMTLKEKADQINKELNLAGDQLVAATISKGCEVLCIDRGMQINKNADMCLDLLKKVGEVRDQLAIDKPSIHEILSDACHELGVDDTLTFREKLDKVCSELAIPPIDVPALKTKTDTRTMLDLEDKSRNAMIHDVRAGERASQAIGAQTGSPNCYNEH